MDTEESVGSSVGPKQEVTVCTRVPGCSWQVS